MLRRRGRALAAVIVAAMLAATAAVAFAAPEPIVAGSGLSNVYGAASYDHTGGTVARLIWSGGTGPGHNVTSVALSSPGHPLFSSATISSGSTAVDRTQYLAAGDYRFYCSIHGTPTSGMRATLHVTGTPLPRPGGGPGAKKKCKKGRKLKHGKCVGKRKHHRR